MHTIRPIPLPAGTEKKAVRALVKARCEAAHPNYLAAASTRICKTIEAMSEFQHAHTIALYWSMPCEVDIRSLADHWHTQKRVLLPVMTGKELTLRPYMGAAALTRHPWGIWESTSAESVDLSQVDLMVLPGTAFDPHGGRVGYGKGFYDRLLGNGSQPSDPRSVQLLTVGVCFDFQLYERVPSEEHDQTVARLIVASAGETAQYDCTNGK